MKKPETHKLETPFVALHSDYLHLTLNPKGFIQAKSLFQEQDILMEMRGATVRQEKLQHMMLQLGRKAYDNCYGHLLWLDRKARVLLRPKGLSYYLLVSSLAHPSSNQTYTPHANCYIDQHGSKLLVKASRIIYKEDKLILQPETLNKFIFNPTALSDNI